MEKIIVYRCSICQQIYGSEKEALECENRHTIPLAVKIPKSYKVLFDEIYGFPRCVDVLMKNGKVVEYIFSKEKDFNDQRWE